MLLSNINVLYQVGTKHWHSAKISTGQWPLRGQKVHHNYRDAVWNRHVNPVSCCSLTMRHGPPIDAQLHAVGRGPLLTATPSLWRCASSNTSPPPPPNLPHLTSPTPSPQDLSESLRWSRHARGIWLGAARQCLFSWRHAGSLWHALC